MRNSHRICVVPLVTLIAWRRSGGFCYFCYFSAPCPFSKPLRSAVGRLHRGNVTGGFVLEPRPLSGICYFFKLRRTDAARSRVTQGRLHRGNVTGGFVLEPRPLSGILLLFQITTHRRRAFARHAKMQSKTR